MASLREILGAHSPLLLLDAASSRVQAGLLCRDAPARWSSRTDEAGVGIFECLDELDAPVDSVGAFAFCEGPGSILGIRTAAMAIRAWTVLRPRPVFAYVALAVAAEALGTPGPALITDARRGHWMRLARGGPLERVPREDLAGDLAAPEGFRHWDPPPAGTRPVPYDLAGFLGDPAVMGADLFRETEAPDALLLREPQFQKWVPQIHRAP
jgi:tRNA threonylcarbamoyladenosine biosynthesis protein TsaB